MADPFELFATWYAEAQQCGLKEPTSVALATVDDDHQPSCRIVLLKGHSAEGFVFYTNLNSQKGRELQAQPKAALCFHWMPLCKQVRIQGSVSKIEDAKANAYWESRPRESQLGAWASEQSATLPDRQTLIEGYEKRIAQYEGKPIPRPLHWSGFVLRPTRMEFWEQGDHRLHHRQVFTQENDAWASHLVYP